MTSRDDRTLERIASESKERSCSRLLCHLLSAVTIFFAGCATVPEAEIERAQSYLFPRFKIILQPDFAMTAAERAKAIRESYKIAGTSFFGLAVYELIVSAEGKVVKIRTAKPYSADYADQYFTRAFMRSLEGNQFRADPVANGYRTFYYMILIQSKTDMHGWPGTPP